MTDYLFLKSLLHPFSVIVQNMNFPMYSLRIYEKGGNHAIWWGGCFFLNRGLVPTCLLSMSVVFRESVRKKERDCIEKKGFAGNCHFQGTANFGYLEAI